MFTPFAFVKSVTSITPTPTGSIPTTGLLLGIDISDITCYPGSGSTVYNLANLALYGTLGTDATVTGSYINFKGNSNSTLLFSTNDYDLPGSAWSYVIKVNPQSADTSYWAEKSDNFDKLSIVYGYNGEACRPWNGSYHNMDPVSTPIGQTNVIAFTHDTNGITNNYKSYKNSVLQQELSSDFTPTDATGFRFNGFDNGDWRLFNFYFYNRALTAQEVEDIYNYVI